MLTVTRDLVLPTTITASAPTPSGYTQELHSRPFKAAVCDTLFRAQFN
jgi:hypothetical protein